MAAQAGLRTKTAGRARSPELRSSCPLHLGEGDSGALGLPFREHLLHVGWAANNRSTQLVKARKGFVKGYQVFSKSLCSLGGVSERRLQARQQEKTWWGRAGCSGNAPRLLCLS